MGARFAYLEILFKFHKSALVVGTSADEKSIWSPAAAISHLLSIYSIIVYCRIFCILNRIAHVYEGGKTH